MMHTFLDFDFDTQKKIDKKLKQLNYKNRAEYIREKFRELLENE
jgi:Arc/MetJ-type ribon-helix-helix transcriptional regulator